MKSVRTLVPQTHWPLKRLALCLDCDECFEISDACPACGSKTWTSLARFLDLGRSEGVTPLRAAAETRAPHIVVVPRERKDLYQKLRKTLADSLEFEVVLDRRDSERRDHGVRQLRERRGNERRAQPALSPDRCTILIADLEDKSVKKARASRA